MNPNDETQRTRLSKSVEHSYRQIEPFRNLVRGLVEEYAGSGYGALGARKRHETYLNLLNQAVDAATMSLVANRPRVLISTRREHLKYFSKHFQLALNNLIREIELEQTLRQIVLNAFFCLGIAKIHLADSAPVMLEEAIWMDPGSPYASSVALDNWVHDMSATDYQMVKFAGDSYRIPFEDLKGSMYDQKVVAELAPTSKNEVADDRLEKISKGYEVDPDEYEPMVDLLDLWMPREKKVFTFPIDRNGFKIKRGPVADMAWDEPEQGPYKLLHFNDVPENIMPASAAAQVSALARLANSIMRKQSRRAQSQKQVHLYPPTGAKDAQSIQRASDDEFREAENPESVRTIKMGGIDPESQAFLLGVVQFFDRMSGNLVNKLGLGPQAKTYGQETLISGQVSNREALMQYRVLDFTRRVVSDLGCLLWNDVTKTIPGRMGIEGASKYSVDATWRPDDREGGFPDYDIDIDVCSMPYQSPAQKISALNGLITQIYAPLAQILMQQGGQINLQKLTEIYSEFLNLPELTELVQFVDTAPPEGGGSGPGMPSSTSREYVRRNVPTGGTPESQSAVQQAEWMSMAGGSGQANPDQVASLNR